MFCGILVIYSIVNAIATLPVDFPTASGVEDIPKKKSVEFAEMLEEVLNGPAAVTDDGSAEIVFPSNYPKAFQYFGKEDVIKYFDENAETGREIFEDEMGVYGDATLLMTPLDVAQFLLCVLGSAIALYGWYFLGIELHQWYYQ